MLKDSIWRLNILMASVCVFLFSNTKYPFESITYTGANLTMLGTVFV